MMSTSNLSEMNSKFRVPEYETGKLQDVRYSHAPYNEVSVKDGPPIRRWSLNIIIFDYNIIILIHIVYNIIIPLCYIPTLFSTVTYCTGLLPRSNRIYHID